MLQQDRMYIIVLIGLTKIQVRQSCSYVQATPQQVLDAVTQHTAQHPSLQPTQLPAITTLLPYHLELMVTMLLFMMTQIQVQGVKMETLRLLGTSKLMIPLL